MTPSSKPSEIDIWEHVLQDIEGRRKLGLQTYGKALTATTLPDPLWAAYEEALDLVVYLRAAIEMQQRKTNNHGQQT